MSEQREALAEALWRQFGYPSEGEWEELLNEDRDDWRADAQALIDSDALAQMLAQAFRKGREMGVTNANVNAERDGYRRGQAEVAAAVEAVGEFDAWLTVAPGVRVRVMHAHDVRAALTTGAADRARAEHDCETCETCLHNGNKCCGCYDGACCQETNR